MFGDAGYQGVEKREENLELPVTWHIAMRPSKRKALPKTTVGELMEKLEHAKASIRAKVEHPFHVVKNLFMHRKTRYKGMVKNTAQMFSLFGLANLLLARRWLCRTDSLIIALKTRNEGNNAENDAFQVKIGQIIAILHNHSA